MKYLLVALAAFGLFALHSATPQPMLHCDLKAVRGKRLGAAGSCL